MKKPIRISASIACANFGNLEAELRHLESAEVDLLHFDFMDGRFVPNFGLDFSLMETVSKLTDIPLDCHLMIEEPERFIDRVAAIGPEYITIHFESTYHVQKALQQIRGAGCRPGIALNPATAVQNLEYILDDVEMVNVMTVNPGAVGQSLVPAMMRKIGDARQFLDSSGRGEVDVEVDGNVSFVNIPAMLDAGATVLVGGTSSIFHKNSTIPEAVQEVRNLVGNFAKAQ